MAQRMNKSNNKNENKIDYKNNNKFVKNEHVKKNTREDRREVDAPIREDVVEGRNAVIEALKSDRTIEQILIANGNMEGSINKIIAMAKEKRVVIKEVDRKKLDSISETGTHQGVIAIVTPFKYSEVEDILKYAEEKGEKPFIIILDELEDPHNLGSIVRTAELSGVHGIIIPKRRNVGVTSTVYKSAAGAIEHMKIAKVTNINTVIDELKEVGVWVYGAEIDGDSYSYETDFSGACALIIGSEGRGMSKLTKDKCDKLVKIPMVGKINSLNASVAGGIMMYEILKSRLLK
ncbi:23S rRNA (guanosine(2251)-2'-O)-methyltransferase RlmB [Clostridium zeae]|uniref:23S rRNA (Guanosine(2251)-2'-O)-methyltransferase RlmB n=1 Tax=Clostridium zeae TaxID=2759022 RepID=A0ABQ1EDH4_9CLOT|nr:23S rRNA (guanosine(2251)-2'-O)-methyltransferase RlmB [Clostridium zeae]GFZ32873.1 23S rRNA (guanosine(2251)-2'-O)-methyltransferase RlmB [Clostridium zeae]